MYLLNVHTRKLELFLGEWPPPYAILSHRWEEEEFLFKDIERRTAHRMKGFYKIDKCCKQAAHDGLSYAWIDTCCIDKNSSNELSEAINSMYRWYEKSKACYVYLSDIRHPEVAQWVKSNWFSRGWTLQELIAPRDVYFFDHRWSLLGSKFDFEKEIEEATGIPGLALLFFKPQGYTIAQRMGWAATRTTTRGEDRAYSLLGIFDINMPLLYGEGETKAFARLQEEILRSSDDHSIFAWSIDPNPNFGLLAASLESFADSRRVSYLGQVYRPVDGEFSLSTRGFYTTLRLVPWYKNLYIALLDDCTYTDKDGNFSEPATEYGVGMFLSRQSTRGNEMRRVRLDEQTWVLQTPDMLHETLTPRRRTVLIQRKPLLIQSSLQVDFVDMDVDAYGLGLAQLRPAVLRLGNLFQPSTNPNAGKITTIGRGRKAKSGAFFALPVGKAGVVVIVVVETNTCAPVFIHLGYDLDFNLICLVSMPKCLKSATDVESAFVEFDDGSGHKEKVIMADNETIVDLIDSLTDPPIPWKEQLSDYGVWAQKIARWDLEKAGFWDIGDTGLHLVVQPNSNDNFEVQIDDVEYLPLPRRRKIEYSPRLDLPQWHEGVTEDLQILDPYELSIQVDA